MGVSISRPAFCTLSFLKHRRSNHFGREEESEHLLRHESHRSKKSTEILSHSHLQAFPDLQWRYVTGILPLGTSLCNTLLGNFLVTLVRSACLRRSTREIVCPRLSLRSAGLPLKSPISCLSHRAELPALLRRRVPPGLPGWPSGLPLPSKARRVPTRHAWKLCSAARATGMPIFAWVRSCARSISARPLIRPSPGSSRSPVCCRRRGPALEHHGRLLWHHRLRRSLHPHLRPASHLYRAPRPCPRPLCKGHRKRRPSCRAIRSLRC